MPFPSLRCPLRRLALAPLLGAALAAGSAQAGVHSLTNLFVFGDSLSDNGNSKAISDTSVGATFPPPPYKGGRFSNGDVAVEYLWRAFNPSGGALMASLAGGSNFAIGGATTGTQNFIQVWDNTPVGLRPYYAGTGNAWQLDAFKTPTPRSFDPETSLFVVWLFPNDAFWAGATGGSSVGSFDKNPPPSNLDLTGLAVYNIKGTIEQLASYGAKNFLVPNSPDMGLVPEFNGDPVKSKAFSDLSIAFNSQLATQLNSLSLNNPELDITAFQTDALFAEVRNNPGAFGFSNTTNRCISALSCITGDPAAQSTYLFWDGTHPTTAGHAMIGQRFYQAVYEPVPGPLPAAGAAAALAWSRSLRRRVRPHPQKTTRSCAGQCPAD